MIRITEVGPRDGLQNETAILPTEAKVAFVDALSQTGADEIEVSSFVSPKWVPQLADADALFARIKREPNVTYSALVPNERGLDRALAARADKISVFVGASESFTQKNINTSVNRALDNFGPVTKRALNARLAVRGYISVAFHCPYEGPTPPEKTASVVKRLFDLGAQEVALGDTLGDAHPHEVSRLLELLLKDVAAEKLILHFHDTFGRAAHNVRAAYASGIRAFDSSAGGLGGCPYAPDTTGNISTEQLVDVLTQLDETPHVDVQRVQRAHALVRAHLGACSVS